MIRATRRRGFTLIELLVTIFIIGILAALLLAAVQQARAASLRLLCSNNLKSIGLAIHNHAQAQGKFPSGVGKYPADTSYLVQVLPYMEQTALYNSINLADGVQTNSNITAFGQAPDAFLCPSDSSRGSIATARAINYGGNAGRSVAAGDGVFIKRPLADRDVQDGLSQTAGVAEWIAGPGIGNGRQRNTSKYRLRVAYDDSFGGLTAFIRACEALDEAAMDLTYFYPSKGQLWLGGGLSTTLYNHVIAPNLPSCSADFSMDATTAGSYHGGGVNVLTMDGGVHFVKSTIDRRVWSAVGSRSGGEGEATID